MKLNWFSPVPPAPSAVALHNAVVLPELSRRATVTVWVHQTTWSPELEDYARVSRYDPDNVPWAEINSADASIYHLGNEPNFHGPIWRVNRQHPGVVVLHDLGLQYLFAILALNDRGLIREEYRQMMAFHYPDGGARLAEAFLNGEYGVEELCESCPLTLAALENATAVGVHTQIGSSLIESVTTLPVKYVPLATEHHQPSSSSDAKPDDGLRRIIMFGFIGTNRRLESVLQVLRDFPEKHRFCLDVYGKVSDETPVRHMIDDFGLREIVTIHGFVPELELATALTRSDLALNLRDPTMGEASVSQLQIWQHALPSLVTDTGWYSTLPKDTVAMVGRESELQDIENHLSNLLREPETYRAIGRNGRRHVEEHHTVDAYVGSLLELVDASLRARPSQAVSRIARRAGRAISPWFSDSAAGVLLPSLAETISRVFDESPPAEA